MTIQRYISLFGILLAGLGLFWLWQEINNPQKMPVRIVQIDSAFQHVSQQQLQSIILPYVKMSFFTVNVTKLRSKLLELPWIAEASIQLVWPDKIKIQLREQQAKAWWRGRALINEQGELFTPELASVPKNLPHLLGPEGFEKKTLHEFDIMSKMLHEIGLSIAQLSVSDRLSWSLRLNNGTTLLLGHDQPLKRLKQFVIIYPDVFAGNSGQASRVDIRYPNGMAVLWQADSLVDGQKQ